MNRPLKSIEKIIISTVLSNSNYSSKVNLDEILVCEMSDGAMGSIEFVSDKKSRAFFADIGKLELIDTDGVPVIAVLSIDQYNDFFQLDIWKVDFSPSIDLRLLLKP